MKNLHRYFNTLVLVILVSCVIACEPTSIEPVSTIDDGGGTLSEYKAYSLNSTPGEGDVYGRVVFWRSLDDKTLVQLSLYNVATTAEHMSAIFSGTTAATGSQLLSLYSITETGEGYGFGEFSTSKYFVISGTDFYDDLDSYDANIQIMMSSTDNTVIASGDIGMNAEPVESN